MMWTAYQWIWQVEGPLFVGMSPAGTLNRCRLYVPARAIHGAVTAELARIKSEEKALTFPDYEKFGKEVGENCRFTYFYPSEKIGENYVAWLPHYVERKGLLWCPCSASEEKAELSDRAFRRRLLDSRFGTAIAPESDAAAEGTLRETECITPWWRDSTNPKKAVFLLGYIFLKENGFSRKIEEHIHRLFIGGDTRYGLGKIRRVEWKGVTKVFEMKTCLEKEHPQIESNILWGHAKSGQLKMHGMQEFLGGWDRTVLLNGERAWVPGSVLSSESSILRWEIDSYGYWSLSSKHF
jgi:hypothetical protein